MDTRTHLLDQAEHLARQRGFDGFSFADLAAGADIRKASVHYHFPAKGDLSQALIARYRAVFMERLHDISLAHPTAGARLLRLLDLYRIASEGGRSLCLCVALSVTQAALPKETIAEIVAFHRDVTAWLEAVFRLGQSDGSLQRVVDPRAEAQAAMAQVEGAQIMARAAGDPSRFEAAIFTLVSRAI
ncbi:TetR/AcrR family transcriptional regulator [Tateyamaria omphalii]|uniref:TetR family transcriptional regulator n=1 Tax=Tateyamaria omphalii TaxID=299262 RepID=A0A1P8MXV8_9RHOB|nr:TetR/AcrR family transcriptional regulator [Tateyamaria omphalii]APX12927.1 TetR family transcriptional regulator [Tateyamaria omphalii]